MKKNLLILAFSFLFSTYSFAQKNTGFENWTNTNNIYDPTDWFTLNFINSFVFPGSNPGVIRAQPYSGTFSLGLVTTIANGVGLPSLATQQSYYLARPKSVSLYYKYTNTKPGDSAEISINLSLGATSSPLNPIGKAKIKFLPAKNWTKVQSDIVWTSALAPDSLSITIFKYAGSLTDTLSVDDIALSMTGLDVDQTQKPVYNNFITSSNYLVLDPALISNSSSIIIRNILGQVVINQTILENAIDLNNIQNGLYTYEIITDNDTPIVGKFIR